MKKVSAAFLIAGLALTVALVGCGGGGGGGGTPNPPPPSGTLTLTGRVINNRTGNGVGNVLVKFGANNAWALTHADGTFSLDTGVSSAAIAYAGVTTKVFTVSTENLPQPPASAEHLEETIYTASVSVYYDYNTVSGYFRQSGVPVPPEVLNGSSSSLGTIDVFDLSDTPPPPGF